MSIQDSVNYPPIVVLTHPCVSCQDVSVLVPIAFVFYWKILEPAFCLVSTMVSNEDATMTSSMPTRIQNHSYRWFYLTQQESICVQASRKIVVR